MEEENAELDWVGGRTGFLDGVSHLANNPMMVPIASQSLHPRPTQCLSGSLMVSRKDTNHTHFENHFVC